MNLEQAKELVEEQLKEKNMTEENRKELEDWIKTTNVLIKIGKEMEKAEGCINPDGKSICNLIYACDGCPRNPDPIAEQ